MKSYMKNVLNLFIILLTLNIIFITPTSAFSASRLTVVAEASDYQRTSTYDEVMTLLYQACEQSDLLHLSTLTTSTEGRMIPLVIVSKESAKSPSQVTLTGKPPVLIMANIHSGEVEGKEALQLLIREFVEKKKETLAYLDHQTILLIPIFNTDGNDKMTPENRHDNGPETAGERANGQGLDLNRDYLKLESPEVKGLIQLFNRWDPLLVVDMHTTNGSFHREPVTYTAQVNPECDSKLADYMWNNMFPAVAATLKQTYGYDSVPYGNFNDRAKPEKGWSNHAFNARYGNNYLGLRNRFAILDENYSHADFKTRVLSSLGFVKSILQYTDAHISEMKKMAIDADIRTRDSYLKEPFSLEAKVEKLLDFTLKSYEFKVEKIKPEEKSKYPSWYGDYKVTQTDVLKDYKLTYFNKAVPTRTIPLPEAYIIPPHSPQIIENLKHHGIIVETVLKDVEYTVDQFIIKEIKLASHIYQGHIGLTFTGNYETKKLTIQKGSGFVSMRQPLSRLIPYLLEPESDDSLAAWGFLNRKLMPQWRPQPNPYPILRIPEITIPIACYQD